MQDSKNLLADFQKEIQGLKRILAMMKEHNRYLEIELKKTKTRLRTEKKKRREEFFIEHRIFEGE